MKTLLTFLTVMVLVFGSKAVYAHCDALDGPVVKAAQKALETSKVDHVLIWVKAEDENEIRKAFEQALAVRKLNETAKILADRYFFETVVRVHRAGEGAPYTGLKPAGLDLGPAIPAADHALTSGSVDEVIHLLDESMNNGVKEVYKEMIERKGFDSHDVKAGRKFVESYVKFLHYVEGLYQATRISAEHHEVETGAHEH